MAERQSIDLGVSKDRRSIWEFVKSFATTNGGESKIHYIDLVTVLVRLGNSAGARQYCQC